MKTVTKLLAASAVALSMSAASAQAAIFVSFDGVTSIALPVNPMNDTFTYTRACGPTGAACGGFESVIVNGAAPPRPGLLHSESVEVNKKSTGAASFTIWVTRTGFVPLSKKQYQSYTTNNVGGAVNVKLETFISPTNALFGGTSIGSFTNNTNGAASKDITSFFDFSAPGTYSVTHKYVLKAVSSSAQRSASPTIGTAVPEPATWALMIGGFAGAGAMLRRRKTAVAA